MNLRTIGQREARVVLVEDGAENLHRLQHLRRRQGLAADGQHAVADERLGQRASGPRPERGR